MLIPQNNGRAAATNGPAGRMAQVTPSDTGDLPDGVTRGLYVSGAGVLRVDDLSGATVEFVSSASQYHPLRVRRVRAEGTTATGILALY
jgi:hypothetical protein